MTSHSTTGNLLNNVNNNKVYKNKH